MHTYIHTYMHACMHAYIQTNKHTCMHTFIHARTHNSVQSEKTVSSNGYATAREYLSETSPPPCASATIPETIPVSRATGVVELEGLSVSAVPPAGAPRPVRHSWNGVRDPSLSPTPAHAPRPGNVTCPDGAAKRRSNAPPNGNAHGAEQAAGTEPQEEESASARDSASLAVHEQHANIMKPGGGKRDSGCSVDSNGERRNSHLSVEEYMLSKDFTADVDAIYGPLGTCRSGVALVIPSGGAEVGNGGTESGDRRGALAHGRLSGMIPAPIEETSGPESTEIESDAQTPDGTGTPQRRGTTPLTQPLGLLGAVETSFARGWQVWMESPISNAGKELWEATAAATSATAASAANAARQAADRDWFPSPFGRGEEEGQGVVKDEQGATGPGAGPWTPMRIQLDWAGNIQALGEFASPAMVLFSGAGPEGDASAAKRSPRMETGMAFGGSSAQSAAAVATGVGRQKESGDDWGDVGGAGRERAGLIWPAAVKDHHDSANGKAGEQWASKENGSSGEEVRPRSTVGNRLRLKSRRQGQPLGLNSPRGAVEDEVAMYAMYQAPLSLCPLYQAETPLLL